MKIMKRKVDEIEIQKGLSKFAQHEKKYYQTAQANLHSFVLATSRKRFSFGWCEFDTLRNPRSKGVQG